MWRNLLFIVVALVLVLALLSAVALKDNPARAAAGERRVVATDTVEINYFIRGPAGGTAVALLPSYARSVSDFNELVEVLNTAGYRTIAMQPRGIDGSSLPGLNVSYHDYAADLLSVLQAEAISAPVFIIGHAYGNRLARAFASNYPDHTRGLILLAAGGEAATPPEVSSAIVKALFGVFPASSREAAVQFAFFARG